MKIESPDFTRENIDAFLGELEDHERRRLIARLEACAERLSALAGRLPDTAEPGTEQWSALETLAHISVLSKFYGMLTYSAGTGKMTELDLENNVKLRDVLGEPLSRQ